jgi:hypothetical protein
MLYCMAKLDFFESPGDFAAHEDNISKGRTERNGLSKTYLKNN